MGSIGSYWCCLETGTSRDDPESGSRSRIGPCPGVNRPGGAGDGHHMPVHAHSVSRLGLSLALSLLAAACAEDLGTPGGGEALPLMRELPAAAFPRGETLEVAFDGQWRGTGVHLEAGMPLRVWPVEAGGIDRTRIGGAADAWSTQGATLLRLGDRVWSVDDGLAMYAPAAGELEVAINAPAGGDEDVPRALHLAWGRPDAAHEAGLDAVAVGRDDLVAIDALADPLTLSLDVTGRFVEVGLFDPGTRLWMGAAEATPEASAEGGAAADSVSNAPRADPGPMARLLPGEPDPEVMFPGMEPGAWVYRIDGEVRGEVPAGGVLHLPEGGLLEVAANGVGADMPLESQGRATEGLEVVALPRLGVELSTLPWGAFDDALVSVDVSSEAAWTATGLDVGAGDVLRLEVAGWTRGVYVGDTGPVDVAAGGLLVRASSTAFIVPGARVLAPHVRIGDHVITVPRDGLVVSPGGGAVSVGVNGCDPAASSPLMASCLSMLGDAEVAVRVAVAVDRVER